MRLVTRGDLDGLCCAVLITEVEQIDSIELVHPQDITDKLFEVTDQDIMANIPYHPNCAKWFDHHLQTDSNEKPPENFVGAYKIAPSAARVVYDFYNDPRLEKYAELMRETDRLDSATLSMDDVLNPQGYMLLGYTIDSRTGLGDYKQYFMLLLDLLKKHNINEILRHPEVARRIEQMMADWDEFKQLLKTRSRQQGNVVITDLRNEERTPTGNRFLIYTLFPDANVSIRVHWGPQKKFVACVVGHSIFNRTCKVSIGELMSDFGGGGHRGAGATPLKPAEADAAIEEMIRRLNE